jgi:RimJ/RimL family protein N-acetyltransferase
MIALRRYSHLDEDHFVSIVTNPDIMDYVGGAVEINKAKFKFSEILKDSERMRCWAIVSADDYLGHASLFTSDTINDYEKEILFYLLPNSWGKGFATNVAKRLLEIGFNELNYKSIGATIDLDHCASRAVVEKSGLKLLRTENDEQGEFLIYRIKKEEFS